MSTVPSQFVPPRTPVAIAIAVAVALVAGLAHAGQVETVHGSGSIARPADVASPPGGTARAANRVTSRVIAPGQGRRRPRPNDCVKVRYIAWNRTGKLAGLSNGDGTADTQCLRRASAGIAQILATMVVGEQRRAWIPEALAIPPQADDEQRRGRGDLTYDLTLTEIISAPPTPVHLQAPAPRAKKRPSGVAIEMLKRGDGQAHPGAASNMKLELAGWTSTGVLFESTMMGGQPMSYTMGDLPVGLAEALGQLVVGDRARVWIPASLAYGASPRNKGQPAGNLIYEIALIGFD
jgi:FKBP-type peptidyl-prolyl cis-trans isomerase